MTTSSESDNRPSAANPRSRWFAVAAVLVALSPFALVEGVIRANWTPSPAVDLTPTRQPDLFVRDGDVFRIDADRLNFFRPASFDAVKRPATRRIFVLGGSTTQGRPYATETAFSTWLSLRLNANVDEVTYEVVNVGGVSYASYRVAKILDEVLRHDADAIVLYTGHNEFLEDRTYAAANQLSTFRRVVTDVAAHWKTAQFVAETFREHSNDRRTTTQPEMFSGEVDAVLDHAGGLDAYQPDAAWRQRIEADFAATFARMVDAARDAGVPMIVCTPASDIVATPPFKSVPLPSDAPEPAALYAAGRAKWDQGDVQAATKLLIRARDADVCPLRATTPIIDAIREICESRDVPLVDTESVLDARNAASNRIADGVADPEFFADHVHPTIAGHQRIASAIADQFGRLGWYRQTDASDAAYAQAAAAHLAGLDETYYARGRQRLAGLKRWAAGRAAIPLADDDVLD
jgi:lysophospholipase L1-like esterase